MRIYAAREQHDKRHNYGGDYRIVIDVNCEIDNAKEIRVGGMVKENSVQISQNKINFIIKENPKLKIKR